MNDRSMPIRITQDEHGAPSVVLAGVELAGVLATDGVRIQFVDPFQRQLCSAPFSVPEITLTFAPGSLQLDFDVDLLRALLSDAEASR